MPSDIARVGPWIEREQARILATLQAWLRIPSISALPGHRDDVEASARFCAEQLTAAGLEGVRLLRSGGAPAVYGEWLHAGADAPTALVYGHHDVQPVDPVEAWSGDPFEPRFVDGECRARGAIDDKGQVLYQIEAARALLQLDGSLPVNLKFLVEGEEEVGSPHFEALLEAHRDLLDADAVVVSDTSMLAPDVPSTCVSMRGLVAFTVRITTAARDLHSGSFGGAVPNPLHHAARLVAALHDADGRVTLPGFYDDVVPLSAPEADSLARQPFDEAAFLATATTRVLEGERGRSTLERIGARPTAEVVGLSGGYAGEGIKTIVPAHAEVKLTFRLVADQDPDRVAAAFDTWLHGLVPEGIRVEVERHGGVRPARTPLEHWSVQALRAAITSVWGAAPLYTREGGSGPEEALGRVLDAPVLFLGVGLPDDRIHAPNERMVMAQFWRGLRAAAELWPALAAAHRDAASR